MRRWAIARARALAHLLHALLHRRSRSSGSRRPRPGKRPGSGLRGPDLPRHGEPVQPVGRPARPLPRRRTTIPRKALTPAAFPTRPRLYFLQTPPVSPGQEGVSVTSSPDPIDVVGIPAINGAKNRRLRAQNTRPTRAAAPLLRCRKLFPAPRQESAGRGEWKKVSHFRAAQRQVDEAAVGGSRCR